jgi:hypothetical protein
LYKQLKIKIMTVGDMLDILEGLDQNTEVRFASQPNYPFEYNINDVVVVEVENKRNGHSEEIVYLGEGSQIGYLPGDVSIELGWR